MIFIRKFYDPAVAEPATQVAEQPVQSIAQMMATQGTFNSSGNMAATPLSISEKKEEPTSVSEEVPAATATTTSNPETANQESQAPVREPEAVQSAQIAPPEGRFKRSKKEREQEELQRVYNEIKGTSETGLTGGGGLSVTSTTDATSSTAAAGKFSGGISTAKKMWVGTNLIVGTTTTTTGQAQVTFDSSATQGLCLHIFHACGRNFRWKRFMERHNNNRVQYYI